MYAVISIQRNQIIHLHILHKLYIMLLYRRIEKEKKQLYIKYKTMEEYSSLEDNVDMGEMGQSDARKIASGASPLSADKRAFYIKSYIQSL